MNLCNINHSFNYELEKLCRIFLPNDKINILNELKSDRTKTLPSAGAVLKEEDSPEKQQSFDV